MCKGNCKKYEAKKAFGTNRYAEGQKYCSACETWLYWDGLYCPCCSHRVRTRPIHGRSKRKFTERRNV